MATRLSLTLAAAVVASLKFVRAQPLGTPWSCGTVAPGPLSTWINELLLVPKDAVGPNGPAVVVNAEITAAPEVALAELSLVVIGAGGGVLAETGLGACSASAAFASGGVPPPGLVFLVCALNVPEALPALSSLALVFTGDGGAASAASAVPLQHIELADGAAPFLGMPACILPTDQAAHLSGEAGSLQLIDGAGAGAGYDSRWSAADVFAWRISTLPPTWGAPNTWPVSAWGAFAQTTVAAVLPAPVPISPALPGGGNGGAASACPLLRETAFSLCSVACGAEEDVATAVQISYEPLQVNMTTPSDAALASCPPLASRSVTRACEPPPPPACALCADGLLDGEESDVDCGGSVPDTTPVDQTLANAVATAAAAYNPLAGAGAGALAPPAAAPPGACQRCLAGRICRNSADCAAGAGLLCAVGVCQPFWVVNASVALDVPLLLVGVSLAGMQLNGSRAALNAGVAAAAGASSGSGAGTPPPAAVSELSWIAVAGAVPSSVLLQLRLAAPSTAAASAWSASLAAHAPRLALVLAESLRQWEPLINTSAIRLGSAKISANPYGLAKPATAGGSEQTAASTAASAWLSLSPGAIAGVVIGALVGVALVAAGAVMAAKRLAARTRAEAAARRAAAASADEGGASPAAATSAEPDDSLAAAPSPTRSKATFAPMARHVNPSEQPATSAASP